MEVKHSVGQSKLVLLATWQVNNWRDELSGQGTETLFGKPADWEDGGLVSQRTIFFELRVQASEKGGGWLVVADFLVQESFVLAAVQVPLATMFL